MNNNNCISVNDFAGFDVSSTMASGPLIGTENEIKRLVVFVRPLMEMIRYEVTLGGESYIWTDNLNEAIDTYNRF